jgi:hypothetical protein
VTTSTDLAGDWGDVHGEWLGALASAVIPALQVRGAVAERGERRRRVEQVVRRPGAVEVFTGEVELQRWVQPGSQIVAATVVSSGPAVEVAGSGLGPLVVDDAALAWTTGVVLEVSATPLPVLVAVL